MSAFPWGFLSLDAWYPRALTERTSELARAEAQVANLTWNHTCTIGVRAMDDQHAILMETLNDLRLALMQGGSRDQVSEGLNRLIDFTRLHFSSEERLLEQSGYPGVVEHRRAHQQLLSQIEEAAHLTQVHDELHTRSLLVFLHDWYLGHVENLDCQYGTWLNEHGIS